MLIGGTTGRALGNAGLRHSLQFVAPIIKHCMLYGRSTWLYLGDYGTFIYWVG
jgi:hypothetical protein